jgi:RiboL-PSP-HEPN
MNPHIVSHRQRIDTLFIKVASTSNPADQSEWSKYLCILVSGFIEESLRVLLEDYTRTRSAPNIQNFVVKQTGNITNCKTSRILEVLSKFSQDWANDFSDQITDEIKNSIDSVIANRHVIAHGKNVNITYRTMSTYYNNVKKAVEILDAIIR